MRDVVTTALDVLGLLLFAAGVGLAATGTFLAVARHHPGAGYVAAGVGAFAAGVTLSVGSWWAHRRAEPGEPVPGADA